MSAMNDPKPAKRDDDDIEQGAGYSMPPEDGGAITPDDDEELEQGLGYSAPAVRETSSD